MSQNGKGSRDRSNRTKYRRGFEYMMKQIAKRKQREVEDMSCSIDGEGLTLAIEKTKSENEVLHRARVDGDCSI